MSNILDDDDLEIVGDDAVEFQLIDLTNEEEERVTGPVDIHPTTSHNLTSTRAQVQRTTDLDNSVRLCRLLDGTIVHIGDTVKLKIPPRRNNDPEGSGDFLRVVKISKTPQTNEIVLQGFRIIREKYLVGNDPDGKGPRVNELVQHLVVREDDDRPANVQGLEEVSVSEVECKCTIILTDKPYPYLGFRDQPATKYAHLANKSLSEKRLYIFHNGPLVCRWTRTTIISPNGRIYSGIHRYLSKNETMTPSHLRRAETSVPIPPQDNTSTHSIRHVRTSSLEEIATPSPQRSALLSKKIPYTFFDMYCGGGGASRGADNAGLNVVGGLDHNETALASYEKNNRNSLPLCMDSLKFLEYGNYRIIGRCAFLNISNPCQPFSGAQGEGKNDKVNIEQLYRIKPLIEALKPRVVILENTSGLANIAKNSKYFNKVLNDIRTAGPGYNLRYNIVNMADYGLPQERKRLIIIAAKKGTPLPPFPKPTHGPPGSGLFPYVRIGDALDILNGLGERADRDIYHSSHRQVSRHEQLYDPYTKFVDCIMTKGVETPHWSGEEFTPRELALLQSLPYHHHLTGSWAQATKQIGNMFPPVMAEIIYRTCAQTLEAFDHGFITADEEIYDLNVTLIEKGIDIPETRSTPTSLVDLTAPTSESPFLYLSRPVLSDATHVNHSSAWAKRTFK